MTNSCLHPISLKPRIDYTLKAVGGSLTALPGISDMIDDTVELIVTDMLQWPHRIVVPDCSDPYVVVYIRPLFKVKTKVIDNNLNPVWDQTFELIAEDKETQSLVFEVFDEDIGQDKRLGVTKLPLIDVEADIVKEIELRLQPSLNMLKIKEKDRGTLTIKILYHEFNKEEQLAALEEEKRILEERKKLKEAGVIESTMDALGSGAGMVGSGIGAGVGLVGTGVGAGVGLVGSGVRALGSSLSKARKFMGRTITGQSSHSRRRSGSTTPVNSV
ncbi:hypothetical protein M0R45_006303 [Rubus argutus]|uniref:C2 domain-containing protein n=1 Tax=Rubus argutus TaxID=59490 RepID=A0AAW1YQ55_RUBAR